MIYSNLELDYDTCMHTGYSPVPQACAIREFLLWFEIEVIIFVKRKSEFDKELQHNASNIDNFTLLEKTETIFIGYAHLGISLEKNRDSDKRVLKPLNLILILFLFPDLPIEGVFLKNIPTGYLKMKCDK